MKSYITYFKSVPIFVILWARCCSVFFFSISNKIIIIYKDHFRDDPTLILTVVQSDHIKLSSQNVVLSQKPDVPQKIEYDIHTWHWIQMKKHTPCSLKADECSC